MLNAEGDYMKLEGGGTYLYDDGIQCFWNAVHVVGEGQLTVVVGPGHCADMSGVIEFAKWLMPGVSSVAVMDDVGIVNLYALCGGKWMCVEKGKVRSG